MPNPIRALLALTRYGDARPPMTSLCTACLPGAIREELASLSHQQDLDELALQNPARNEPS